MKLIIHKNDELMIDILKNYQVIKLLLTSKS